MQSAEVVPQHYAFLVGDDEFGAVRRAAARARAADLGRPLARPGGGEPQRRRSGALLRLAGGAQPGDHHPAVRVGELISSRPVRGAGRGSAAGCPRCVQTPVEPVERCRPLEPAVDPLESAVDDFERCRPSSVSMSPADPRPGRGPRPADAGCPPSGRAGPSAGRATAGSPPAGCRGAAARPTPCRASRVLLDAFLVGGEQSVDVVDVVAHLPELAALRALGGGHDADGTASGGRSEADSPKPGTTGRPRSVAGVGDGVSPGSPVSPSGPSSP